MLPPHVVKLWYLPTFDQEPPPRIERLLSPQEAERHARFKFDKHKRAFLLTRWLVRRVLGDLVGADPAALEFTTTGNGRPALAEPWKQSGIDFNLSHTDGMIVLAVTRGLLVGVDVENSRRKVDLAIARRFFAEDEALDVETTHVNRRRRKFFDYWTLKEAYIKAVGLGLSAPLDQFSIQLAADPLAIRFHAGLADDPAHWRLEQILHLKPYTISLAIRRPLGAQLAIEVTPFT